MLVLKQTIDVGDDIKYKHPMAPPFEDRYTCIPGTVIEIDGDIYRIKLQFGVAAQDEIEIDTYKKALIIIQQIPDPDWLPSKLAKATKIKESDWDGAYLYDDSAREYFKNSKDLYEYYESDDALYNLPTYCFDTKTVTFNVNDVRNLVASLYEQEHEDEDEELQGANELQKAIDTFNEINRSAMTRYYPDYSTVVIIDLPMISS